MSESKSRVKESIPEICEDILDQDLLKHLHFINALNLAALSEMKAPAKIIEIVRNNFEKIGSGHSLISTSTVEEATPELIQIDLLTNLEDRRVLDQDLVTSWIQQQEPWYSNKHLKLVKAKAPADEIFEQCQDVVVKEKQKYLKFLGFLAINLFDKYKQRQLDRTVMGSDDPEYEKIVQELNALEGEVEDANFHEASDIPTLVYYTEFAKKTIKKLWALLFGYEPGYTWEDEEAYLWPLTEPESWNVAVGQGEWKGSSRSRSRSDDIEIIPRSSRRASYSSARPADDIIEWRLISFPNRPHEIFAHRDLPMGMFERIPLITGSRITPLSPRYSEATRWNDDQPVMMRLSSPSSSGRRSGESKEQKISLRSSIPLQSVETQSPRASLQSRSRVSSPRGRTSSPRSSSGLTLLRSSHPL